MKKSKNLQMVMIIAVILSTMLIISNHLNWSDAIQIPILACMGVTCVVMGIILAYDRKQAKKDLNKGNEPLEKDDEKK